MNKCLKWKNKLIVLFPFVIVQTSGYQIQDQNNQSPQPTPEPSQSPQPAPNPQPAPSNPIDRKWSKKLFEKISDGYVFEREWVSRYIPAKDLSTQTTASIDKQTGQTGKFIS